VVGFRRQCGVKAMWIDGVVGHFEIQSRVIAPNLTLAASETRADEKSELPVYRLGPGADIKSDLMNPLAKQHRDIMAFIFLEWFV
jgi:hypothetical protein